jgi:nucleoprotein TPR
MQRARAAEPDRQQAAIAAAVQKVKDETPVPQPTSGELSRQHDEQIRLLTVKHQQELKTAVDTAEAAASASSGSDVDLKAAIAAAIKVHDEEFESQRAEEIAAAVERGRMEQGAKAKLKDQALVRAQSKLKELESRVLEWRKAGLIPEASAAPAATTISATTVPSPTADSPSNPTGPAPTGVSLPRKPSLLVPVVPTEGAGRGRGAARGGTRGARGLPIRGAAPGRGAAPAASTSGGVSILGAAGKRLREDADASDDSLAKRIKPAETPGSKPVAIRRDRVPPPP